MPYTHHKGTCNYPGSRACKVQRACQRRRAPLQVRQGHCCEPHGSIHPDSGSWHGLEQVHCCCNQGQNECAGWKLDCLCWVDLGGYSGYKCSRKWLRNNQYAGKNLWLLGSLCLSMVKLSSFNFLQNGCEILLLVQWRAEAC